MMFICIAFFKLIIDLYFIMDQQLIYNTIELQPSTMDTVLPQIQLLLSTQPLPAQLLSNVIKSLFYGVWNFDKMINQHNLNVQIAEMFQKLPKKNSLLFFRGILKHLQQKWRFIDHHRINKFMQMVNLQTMLKKQKFEDKNIINFDVRSIQLADVQYCIYQDNGLAYHIIDIIFPLLVQNNPVSINDLSLYLNIFTKHPHEHTRLYVVEHGYAPFKQYLLKNNLKIQDLQTQLQKINDKFLQLATQQENDAKRRNIYTLVGFMKSQQVNFSLYMDEKQKKAAAERQKKTRMISKGKKAEIKKLKKTRKQKKDKQKHKQTKIMSKRKFEDKSRYRNPEQL